MRLRDISQKCYIDDAVMNPESGARFKRSCKDKEIKNAPKKIYLLEIFTSALFRGCHFIASRFKIECIQSCFKN